MIILLGDFSLRVLIPDEVVWYEKITNEEILRINPEFIISYNYRHIIKDTDKLPPIINLHISYLPWNRGADPNYWSFKERTPKGVTIHYIDDGIDTGDIIAQREVEFSDETLKTSYEKLHIEIKKLFKEIWPSIKSRTNQRTKQEKGGSFHLHKDFPVLPLGWDTPVSSL